MSVSKYVDKIWQKCAKESLENELNYINRLLDIDEKITLPDNEDIDYLQLYSDTHPTYEEQVEKIFKSIKEHIQLIQTYTDDERVLAQCNLILKEIKDE